MYNCFLSVVSLVHEDQELLKNYLSNIYSELTSNFADFEIILVNNCCSSDYESAIMSLPQELRKSITMINLSRKVDPDNAIVAGMDRSNGDYTVVLDMEFAKQADLISQLYEKTQEEFDVVYLRYRKRCIPFFRRIFFAIFYWIMRKHSELKIDKNMHSNRIISRRALNSVLRMRENIRYMKGIFSLVGYNSTGLEADIPKQKKPGFRSQVRAAILAITSYTRFFSSLLKWVFIISFLFCIVVTTNALLVKFAQHDIFGNPQHAASGWTFLVVLISVMFSLLCLVLYVMSHYLIAINREIKKRPVYFVESFKRY